MKDKFVITIRFKNVGDDINVALSADSKISDKTNFIAMVRSLPLLVKQLSNTLEAGGRYLVDENFIDRETMRQLLEEAFKSSSKELEKVTELVE